MTLNYYKIYDGTYYHVKSEEVDIKKAVNKKEWKRVWSFLRKYHGEIGHGDLGSSQHERRKFLVMKKLSEFSRLALKNIFTMENMGKIPIDGLRFRSNNEASLGYDVAVGLSG